MPESRTAYEQLELNEIRNYPVDSLPKILKMRNCFRNQIFNVNDPVKYFLCILFNSYGNRFKEQYEQYLNTDT